MDYFLARLPAFRRLPEAVLTRLSTAFPLTAHKRGQEFFREGDAPGAVFLLKSGLIKSIKGLTRDEPVILEIIAPGALFGIIAAMDRKPYPVTAVCLLDSEAYRIPAADFHELLQKHPDFAQQVYCEIGEQVRQAQALRTLSKETVDRRIMYILWMLSSVLGNELPILREDIAGLAGTTEETAIRTLGELRRKKFVESGWKSITVLQPEKLKALSEPN